MTGVDNTNGRKWARFALVATLAISVIANITHAVLADSVISLWLRVPGAAVWPVLSFLAIEIIVRIAWERRPAHYLARVFVLGPAIPAVIVSYEHQQSLLTMMGENALVSAIGPLAIDGLMIGCTLALLFTRALAIVEPTPDPTSEEIIAALASMPKTENVEPVPAIEPPAPAKPERERPQPASDALDKAIAALMAGESTTSAIMRSGLSAPTVRRYASVVKTLRLDPNAAIDARKLSVRPGAVDSIREWARLESVR